jgi:phage baseplate assembly protein gpV
LVHPNQRLNLLRQYGNRASPCELKLEAEGCDYFGGANGGNGQVNFYRNGNIAIETAGDTGGGYDVGWINPGEWLEWEEVPIQGSTVHLQVRVASPNDNSSLHFVIDGTSYPSLTVPNTGNWQVYTTIESGTAYAFANGSTHTVRLVCETGGFNINYWQYYNDIPIGDTVTLQSAANNLLVSAPNSTSPLIANQTAPGLSEQFQVVDQSSSFWYGCVALRSLGNNLFVTADPAGTSPLLADGTNAGPAQTFQWSDNADGTISLRALANNMDVCAENAGGLPLINNRINTGPWETFSLATVLAKITANLSGSNLAISWPANYQGWILQTNLVGLGASGAWGNVPGSQTNTQVNFPINNPGMPMEFFRLRHP